MTTWHIYARHDTKYYLRCPREPSEQERNRGWRYLKTIYPGQTHPPAVMKMLEPYFIKPDRKGTR